MYHSEDLQRFTASKTHPTETLRQHLLNVTNWVLFFLRTPSSFSLAISVVLVGNPGGTPGPGAMEDPSPLMSHRSVVRVGKMIHPRRRGPNSPFGAIISENLGINRFSFLSLLLTQ